jgi:release factor glutamine methyltransferase
VRGVTVADALDGAATAIGAGGSPTARLDAEVLLAHVLGVDRTALFTGPERTVEGAAVRRYQDLVRRRSVGHEPVAYLVGRRGFRHLELEVDARVLIPRPETEHVVEAVVELAPAGARVVDVGTGSGAIALALKDERPDLAVTASDISPEALAAARANAARLGLDVAFAQADLVPPGAWDVIVSNPPYVADGDELGADVRAHEPPLALFAGADGLDVLRRLVAVRAPLLVVEVGAGQAAQVAALARAGGYAHTQLRPDLAGIDRVVVAWG